jgi:hypothetical protein
LPGQKSGDGADRDHQRHDRKCNDLVSEIQADCLPPEIQNTENASLSKASISVVLDQIASEYWIIASKSRLNRHAPCLRMDLIQKSNRNVLAIFIHALCLEKIVDQATMATSHSSSLGYFIRDGYDPSSRDPDRQGGWLILRRRHIFRRQLSSVPTFQPDQSKKGRAGDKRHARFAAGGFSSPRRSRQAPFVRHPALRKAWQREVSSSNLLRGTAGHDYAATRIQVGAMFVPRPRP